MFKHRKTGTLVNITDMGTDVEFEEDGGGQKGKMTAYQFNTEFEEVPPEPPEVETAVDAKKAKK